MAGMQLNITFRRFEATDALKEYVLEKVERVKKRLHHPETAEVHVVLSLERHLHHADITLYAEGRVLRGHESCDDMYAAIDLAVERMDRQLRRHRDKVRQHHAKALVHHGSRLLGNGNGHAPREKEAGPAGSTKVESPRVIRANELVVTLSVEDAMQQLELRGEEFLVFHEPSSQRVNVMYRRKDGHFGLIEAGSVQPARRREERAP
jgi:putative sigma-54 modulation protein